VRLIMNAVLGAVVTLWAANARADMADDLRACPDEHKAQVAQEACTRLITAEQLPSSQRAIAYLYRGHALRSLGDRSGALAQKGLPSWPSYRKASRLNCSGQRPRSTLMIYSSFPTSSNQPRPMEKLPRRR
jgi:hypothetical protein